MDDWTLYDIFWMAVVLSGAVPLLKGIYEALETTVLDNHFPTSRYAQQVRAAKDRTGFNQPSIGSLRAVCKYEFTEFPTFRALYRWIRRR